VEDTAQPGPLQGVFLDTVAVAPTASGWLVAACGGGNVFVHALDASGKKIARTVLSDGASLTLGCSTGSLVLAPRPGGGALLMWTAYYDTVAVLIGADGSAGKLQSLMDSTAMSVGAPTGAWTGDAYTVAMPVALDVAGYSIALRLLRIAARTAR
jgi:hypothetical protein